MDVPNFNENFKNKVKNYLIKVCKVKNPTETDILESCQSLYYLGKARKTYLSQINQKK